MEWQPIATATRAANGENRMNRGKRTYIGEMEWALNRINEAVGNQNPNRAAQLRMAIDYGLAVAIARRSKEPVPPRPDVKGAT